MTRFFIERPIFAWAVSIFIMLVGVISIAFLPVSQYPDVAPVTIQVTATYPGAPPERLYDGVTRIIEEELNGIPGLMYFESTSDTSGQAQIMASFAPGSDPSKATVAVQNRIKRIEARLPRTVTQQGVIVEEASTSFLQVVVVSSRDGSMSETDLGDLAARRILGELRRVPGVGRATLFSSEKALRIWIDPVKLVGFGMTPGDVTAAVGAQNAQVASGSQAVYLLALALFCVFLCLAALYESWSIPLAVLLVVPTGVVGAVFAMLLRDMPNDVYFKVGLITVIGLTAKNAILIIEVAKELVEQGRSVSEAALEACELRFRPIVMTSFAFILGVVPLAIATGASMNSQRAIGTGVLGGMITATVLAIFVTPHFYVLIARAFGSRKADEEKKGLIPAGTPAHHGIHTA